MWKDGLRSAFTFSRHERRGILVLTVLLVSAWWLPMLSGRRLSKDVEPTAAALKSLDSLTAIGATAERTKPSGGSGRFRPRRFEEAYRRPSSLFAFDPNEADSLTWRRLGLTERQARTIRNYVAKGGRFRRPEDLLRIYGFPEEAYPDLAPYVRIEAPKDATGRRGEGRSAPGFSEKSPQRRKPLRVGVNTADSAVWESLPGIGPVLASRIVRFRDRLGGFHSVTQVGETFGLPDSVFSKALPFLDQEPLTKEGGIDVNGATVEELRKHPYVDPRMARSIVAYREQHGPYSRSEDLLSIETMTQESYTRILPYIRIR